jgi:hypothetical protein
MVLMRTQEPRHGHAQTVFAAGPASKWCFKPVAAVHPAAAGVHVLGLVEVTHLRIWYSQASSGTLL